MHKEASFLNKKVRWLISIFKDGFPKSYKNRFIKVGKVRLEGMTLLPSILSDDRVFFTFENGLLVGFEY